MDFLNLNQKVEKGMTRCRRPEPNKFEMKGNWKAQHLRGGVILNEYNFHNDITNEGKNTIFDTMFNATTQITAWYIGLISSVGYTALAATDVMASHAGWTEFTGYTEANRVTWVSTATSGQTITNPTPAQFDFNATGTVLGIFIASNNTISGTTGKLWSTGLFSTSVPVVSGDQLKATYTLNS